MELSILSARVSLRDAANVDLNILSTRVRQKKRNPNEECNHVDLNILSARPSLRDLNILSTGAKRKQILLFHFFFCLHQHLCLAMTRWPD